MTAAGVGGVVARRGLFERLSGPAQVTVVSAPAGSGKTVLLRSWIAQAGLAESAGWVAAGPDGRDPQRFWLAVLSALRGTAPGSALVQALTATPDLDGWAIAERLLTDLSPLRVPLCLVVDDLHELDPDVLRQLELLVLRGAAGAEVRAGRSPRRAAGPAPAAAGRPAGRAPGGRPAVQPGRGAGAVRGGRGAAVGGGGGDAATSAPRGGRRGCGWRRCRWPPTRIRSGSPPSSPVPNERSPNTYWPRCSTGRATRSGACCCAPRSWIGSTGHSPTC